MNTGILLGILGILFINQCLCLKKDQESNSLSGAYFHNVGTYNFVDTRDETFLTSYTLTGLENALSNAKTKNELTYNKEIRDLEENLNNIYRVCNKNRRNYLPYGTTSIPENQLKNELEKALDDSTSILSDLISLASKNYTEKFDVKAKMNKTDRYNNYNYLYPKYVSDFEVAKKYINFTFGLEKISRNSAVINVKMAIPVLVKAELKRVIYVPKKLHQSHEFEFLKDQSVNNLAVLMSFDGYRSYSSGQGYFLIKNMDTCQLVNETFLCDPSIMMKVQSSDDTCITKLYQSDCRWSDNYDCNRIRDKCGYEKSSRHNEFTHLSDNKFFALFTREANYHYKCEDGREEQGRLQFYSWGNNKFTGTVEVEENCSLITAFSSIINKDGIFEIKQVDDEEMIWADIPKIIGIPVWIFAISVAVICLIVLMLLITWICICVRRCKAKKASQYANLTNSG